MKHNLKGKYKWTKREDHFKWLKILEVQRRNYERMIMMGQNAIRKQLLTPSIFDEKNFKNATFDSKIEVRNPIRYELRSKS